MMTFGMWAFCVGTYVLFGHCVIAWINWDWGIAFDIPGWSKSARAFYGLYVLLCMGVVTGWMVDTKKL